MKLSSLSEFQFLVGFEFKNILFEVWLDAQTLTVKLRAPLAEINPTIRLSVWLTSNDVELASRLSGKDHNSPLVKSARNELGQVMWCDFGSQRIDVILFGVLEVFQIIIEAFNKRKGVFRYSLSSGLPKSM